MGYNYFANKIPPNIPQILRTVSKFYNNFLKPSVLLPRNDLAIVKNHLSYYESPRDSTTGNRQYRLLPYASYDLLSVLDLFFIFIRCLYIIRKIKYVGFVNRYTWLLGFNSVHKLVKSILISKKVSTRFNIGF